MKTSFLFFCLFSSQIFSEEICNIDFDKYKLQAPTDQVHCQNDPKIPADKAVQLVNPFLNFVTGVNEANTSLRKLQVLEHFLKSPQNSKICKNFSSLKLDFQNEFQKNLATCEKGPDLLGTQKKLCEWVLGAYNQKIIDTFYNYWSEVGKDGKATLRPGKYMEDLEMPIRAHNSWCQQVKKNYKQALFLYCNETQEWVLQFELTKKVATSMKKDMKTVEEVLPESQKRENSLREACKYFDKNAINNLNKSFFLKCI